MATAARPATVSGPTTVTRSAAASTVVGTITSVGIPDRASKGGRSTMDRFTGRTGADAGRWNPPARPRSSPPQLATPTRATACLGLAAQVTEGGNRVRTRAGHAEPDQLADPPGRLFEPATHRAGPEVRLDVGRGGR